MRPMTVRFSRSASTHSVDRRRSHFVKAAVAKKNVPEMTLVVSEKTETEKEISCAA
ncbi:hypothetical protein GNP81_00425 [Aliivibrio fischeri]|uniref:hypothetical protein n=2 Tax=Aliivibrio fischeri TaxID=668 RepID=UPI0012D8DC4C|nr:hypothetical protein [Aliivibrio fischeri]MUI52695.1 hypothetical protein [Aliivibrio fischeri]MUJ37467.1 hypothetical protein [Aliivibrio fischeri]MUK61243.1 hypothetical protein [Aliivibrio fischeri]MUK67766.1 hypothetical protein [Aliivibrio fischeri]MUK74529.1 hypothetical protein [Aliivibrio fischeri]